MAHATVEYLTEYLGLTAPPARASLLLTRASRDVDLALLCAIYDPADLEVRATLRDATCEQIGGMLDAGDLTGTGAAPTPVGFSIGKINVQRGNAPTGQAAAPVRIGRLWYQAWEVLQLAGLTGDGPQSC